MIPRRTTGRLLGRQRRNGFSLLELILALFLTTVVSALIGGLVQLYLLNESRGRESVRQTQTARAILNMIAEDIRSTVRYQQYDTSGLQQMLSGATSSLAGGAMPPGLTGGGGATGGGGTVGGTGGSAGGGGAGSGAGGTTQLPAGGAPTAGGGSGFPSAGGAGSGGGSAGGGAGAAAGASGGFSSGGSGMSGGSAGGGSMGASSGGGMESGTGPVPPGIFGSESSMEIDVSRMPRPDEYVVQPGDVTRGTLGDMPSDIKTIGYYVQAPRADGVLDPLASLTSQTTANTGNPPGMSGGLVRRSLDRAVTQFAYLNGNSDQLVRTGEVIAPEVLGIEFQYFNASSGWQTQWDSSQLGLPHVVKVTIALQSESKTRTNPLSPGLSLSSLDSGMIQEYGIEFYSMNVVIPGAMLLGSPSASSSSGTSSSGMSSLGL